MSRFIFIPLSSLYYLLRYGGWCILVAFEYVYVLGIGYREKKSTLYPIVWPLRDIVR